MLHWEAFREPHIATIDPYLSFVSDIDLYGKHRELHTNNSYLIRKTVLYFRILSLC